MIMTIYTRAFDANRGQVVTTAVEVEVTFRPSVSTQIELPTEDNNENDVCFVSDTNHLFVYKSGVWLDQGAFDVQDLVEERLMQELS